MNPLIRFLNGDVLRRVEHDDDYDLIWVVD